MIQQHSGIIRKILYLYADNPEDQADLHQEILYQAWKSIDRFKGNSKFSTWLYRLSLNTVLTHKRKNSRLKKEPMNESHEQSVLYPEPSDKSDLLWNAIKKLGDIDKTLISLHLEDYSNDEITEILGISKNHVAVKLHRIRQQLEKQLSNV
ncbi:RNA polymerase sigma factor [Fulvivirga sedimenti]|uniref:RNA polymerase sigma factor n=1 Tax=Fulvivirga sedimenti TaxID=2879465 RepID=A0A9X1HUI3_9BACT|nr:RNA polymerase sigma factor [Fulvivirga sedimenti]MCA6075517.1 RNA polymerase sigma factor [Fulvivirga sedimenti]MCA6076694.1 RNA polymerase sigma factor [Fulvivirga sedimenti]MCA6077822.1 RNA polymerase sigma factor [Fulvivirga sedimenti]